MAGQLSRQDREIIRELRGEGVFEDVSGHLLDLSQGVILIACADGDRFYDMFEHQVRLQVGCRPDPRIHPLTCHGGALAYAPCSPVNRRKRASDVFLDQVSDARELKGINLVALYAHAPCGAAALAQVTLVESIALQIRAKMQIRTLNSGIQVASFFHVDYGNGQKRTYFLSRDKWQEWAESRGLRAVA